MVHIRSNGGNTRGRGSRVSPLQVSVNARKVGLALLVVAYLQYVTFRSTSTAPLITNELDVVSSSRLEEMRRRTLSGNNNNYASTSNPTKITANLASPTDAVSRSKEAASWTKLLLPTLASKLIRGINTTATTGTLPPYIPPPSHHPHLVLHVGPPKTGTTSLQYMLHQYSPELRKDGYYYTGNSTSTIMADFRLCLRRIKKAGGSTGCWTDFVDILEDHRKKGHNLILSNEIISWHVRKEPIFWDLVKEAIKPWLPHLTVVVGYRHLHNFLPSTHYEVQKNQRWPSEIEKGKYVTPLTKFWREQYHRKDQLVGPMPTPASVIQQFRSAYYNVSVLDIETKEQISEFFCRLLPDATNTCQHHEELKRGTNGTLIPSLNKNDGGQCNYDALALVAFQRELLKAEQTRKYLRSKVKYFNEIVLKRGPNDFPLDCLNDTEELQFLHESLQHAHDSGFITPENADVVKKDFFKTKAKKKFCSINAIEAFTEKVWSGFFHNAKTW